MSSPYEEGEYQDSATMIDELLESLDTYVPDDVKAPSPESTSNDSIYSALFSNVGVSSAAPSSTPLSPFQPSPLQPSSLQANPLPLPTPSSIPPNFPAFSPSDLQKLLHPLNPPAYSFSGTQDGVTPFGKGELKLPPFPPLQGGFNPFAGGPPPPYGFASPNANMGASLFALGNPSASLPNLPTPVPASSAQALGMLQLPVPEKEKSDKDSDAMGIMNLLSQITNTLNLPSIKHELSGAKSGKSKVLYPNPLPKQALSHWYMELRGVISNQLMDQFKFDIYTNKSHVDFTRLPKGLLCPPTEGLTLVQEAIRSALISRFSFVLPHYACVQERYLAIAIGIVEKAFLQRKFITIGERRAQEKGEESKKSLFSIQLVMPTLAEVKEMAAIVEGLAAHVEIPVHKEENGGVNLERSDRMDVVIIITTPKLLVKHVNLLVIENIIWIQLTNTPDAIQQLTQSAHQIIALSPHEVGTSPEQYETVERWFFGEAQQNRTLFHGRIRIFQRNATNVHWRIQSLVFPYCIASVQHCMQLIFAMIIWCGRVGRYVIYADRIEVVICAVQTLIRNGVDQSSVMVMGKHYERDRDESVTSTASVFSKIAEKFNETPENGLSIIIMNRVPEQVMPTLLRTDAVFMIPTGKSKAEFQKDYHRVFGLMNPTQWWKRTKDCVFQDFSGKPDGNRAAGKRGAPGRGRGGGRGWNDRNRDEDDAKDEDLVTVETGEVLNPEKQVALEKAVRSKLETPLDKHADFCRSERESFLQDAPFPINEIFGRFHVFLIPPFDHAEIEKLLFIPDASQAYVTIDSIVNREMEEVSQCCPALTKVIPNVDISILSGIRVAPVLNSVLASRIVHTTTMQMKAQIDTLKADNRSLLMEKQEIAETIKKIEGDLARVQDMHKMCSGERHDLEKEVEYWKKQTEMCEEEVQQLKVVEETAEKTVVERPTPADDAPKPKERDNTRRPDPPRKETRGREGRSERHRRSRSRSRSRRRRSYSPRDSKRDRSRRRR